MPTEKVSTTLDRETLTEVRRLVGPRGLSAYVDAALREKLQRDQRRRALLAYLEELNEVDPLSDEEWAEADDRLARIAERFQ